MIEIEGTLVIRSEEPEAVVSRIAGMTSIGEYRLLPGGDLRILDCYFDTPNGLMRRQRVGLRIRQVGSKDLITLKGPPVTTEWGGRERLEIEEEFSPDAVERVVREIRRFGIEIQPLEFDGEDSLHAMERLGLEALQARKNHRMVRNVASTDAGPTLAEMAIDSVEYLLEGGGVRHYEVEIEAKAAGVSESLGTLMEKLAELHAPALRPWTHDKVVTGMAVQELSDKGELRRLLGAHGVLKPAAYDRIDEYIRNGDV